MLRIASPLSADLQDLIEKILGCCVAVHRELGPGLLESIYARAVRMELEARDIRVEAEKVIPVHYRDRLLCNQRLDLLVDGRVVLEIKSVDALHPIHMAQVLNYLRIAGARVGLLINFNVSVLKWGIRRVIL
jgi:GxxExxY protein